MDQQSNSVTASKPVLASVSIGIAILSLVIWATVIIGGTRGMPTAAVGMIILGTTPLAMLGSGVAFMSLMFRKENPSTVQYGLWINGLIAIAALPVMMIYMLGM